MPTPQNGQTHYGQTDELLERVSQFSGIGA